MVADIQERRGIKHLRIRGKGGKLRFLPMHPVAAERIHAYLETSGHQLVDIKAPLFVPLRGRATGTGISANGIYTVVGHYAKASASRSPG